MDIEHSRGWAPLTLVVGIDPAHPERGVTALELAGELRARGLIRAIVLCHVLPERYARSESGRDEADAIATRVENLAHRALLPYRDPGQRALDGVAVEISFGDPAEQLVRAALDRGADLIVIGPRASGVLHRPNGGLAAHLLAQESVAIMVARPFAARAASRASRESQVPEPACPDCLAIRRESEGAQAWCELHARPRAPMHTLDVDTDEVRWAQNSWYRAGR